MKKQISACLICMHVALRRVCLSRQFAVSVLILFAVLIAESLPDINLLGSAANDPSVSFAAYKMNISMHFGYYIYAAPLLCAFSSSGLFCDDAEAGYDRLCLVNCGKHPYKFGLFGGSTLGGALCLALGVLLDMSILMALFEADYPSEVVAAADAWLPLLALPHGGIYYMIAHACLAFLFGLIWSGIGLIISLYAPVRYVSYLAPFIICFCLNMILPDSLEPLEMLVQMGWRDFTFPKLLTYQMILYVIVAVWFCKAFDRRVLHG